MNDDSIIEIEMLCAAYDNINLSKNDNNDTIIKLDGINNISVVTTPQSYTGLASTGTTTRLLPVVPNITGTTNVVGQTDPKEVVVVDPKNPDPFGYLSKRQFLSINEQFGNVLVPVGEVGFSAWQAKPWDEKIVQRQYSVSTVLGVTEEGRHLVYNNFSMKVNGKDYKIPVQTAKFEEVYPTSEFRFNPRLYLSLGGGVNLTKVDGSVNGSAEVSLFSYGPTKVDSYWRVLSPGIGYDPVAKDFLITLTPAGYNVGKHLPLTQNVFVGPQVTYGIGNNWSLLLGVSAGL
jgi:hypothetical protein